MIINQITIPCTDYERSVEFYKTLGMLQIVSSPPRYARFEMPHGNGATLSVHKVETTQTADVVIYFDHATPEALDKRVLELKRKGLKFYQDPRDETWGWREARLRDPTGNEICLMFAGSIRRFPPWRIDTITE
jgi:hydroxymethylpyrimidine/phosphomethylpyrimidine kinase